MAGPAIRARFAAFGAKYRWLLLFTMLAGSMSTLLAATTVNVALPSIIGAFGLSQDQAQWMSTAFLASSTIAMLANAWCMVSFGPRATYVFALAAFIGGSLLGSVSGTLELIILSRALQGLAAGLIQPMSMFLIFQTFPDHQRGTAMGIFSIGVVLAPAFGPALGGISVDLASWRVVFISTVPLAILSLIAGPFLMPDSDRPAHVKRPPFDWQGLTLLSIALIGFLSAIAGGNRFGWDSTLTVFRFLIASVAAVALIFWELRHPFPALNPAVFRYRQFWTAGIMIAGGSGLAMYGTTYLFPLFVQLVQGYSPTAAGMMMIPAGLAMLVGFPIAGRLTDRVDTRLLMGIGVLCFIVSSFMFAGITASTPYWALVGMMVVSRIGISFNSPASNTTAIRAVPPHLLANATGGASFLMQIGGAFGVNCLAVLLQRRMAFHGDHLASEMNEGNAEFLYQHAMNAQLLESSGLAPLPAYMNAFQLVGQDLAREATVLAFRDCFFVVAVLFVLMSGALLIIPKPKLLRA